jgi:hypothetical protein
MVLLFISFLAPPHSFVQQPTTYRIHKLEWIEWNKRPPSRTSPRSARSAAAAAAAGWACAWDVEGRDLYYKAAVAFDCFPK